MKYLAIIVSCATVNLNEICTAGLPELFAPPKARPNTPTLAIEGASANQRFMKDEDMEKAIQESMNSERERTEKLRQKESADEQKYAI